MMRNSIKQIKEAYSSIKEAINTVALADPWDIPTFQPGPPTQTGVRLFDLAQVYLEDHGYNAKIHKEAYVLTAYNSRIRHFLNNRDNVLAFSIGRQVGLYTYPVLTNCERFNLIWTFRLQQAYLPIKGYNPLSGETPEIILCPYFDVLDHRILCEVADPNCLDHILKETKRHYDSLQNAG